MKKQEIIQQQKEVNRLEKNHKENALINDNRGNQVTNLLDGKETVIFAPSIVSLKSRANKRLKSEHNSIASVLRTIRENFEAIEVQEYISSLKSTLTNKGKNKTSVIINIEDFEYDNVLPLLLYYTDDKGKKVFSRLAKISDKISPSVSYGDYSIESEKTINTKDTTTIIVNDTHTLKPIDNFSIWYVITLVVKIAQRDAINKVRATKLFARKVKSTCKEYKLDVNKVIAYIDGSKDKPIDTLNTIIKSKELQKQLVFIKPSKK